MRIRISKSKNSKTYSIIKDVNINGKRTTTTYENLGNIDKVKVRAGEKDPFEWMKQYLKELNVKNKDDNLPIIITKYQNHQIEKMLQILLMLAIFLQKIYYDLNIHKICDSITDRYQFKYDLNKNLSNLIYSRILFPSSKLKSIDVSNSFIEQPNMEYNHILRSLEIIAKETDFIQSELYKFSAKYSKRNNKILYYDCTNYFFEIEEEDEFRKYGKSKENRPNPIVQMGLFIDGDGIPLAFSMTPGNTNEQGTLKPLEEKIINDFKTSKFVVCTDAGLASTANRKFNNTNDRRFITTQSIKKLKSFLKEWALDLTKDWKLPGSDKSFDISKLTYDQELIKQFKNKTFYKERWIKENGLEQRLIITYSVKYQEYQKH